VYSLSHPLFLAESARAREREREREKTREREREHVTCCRRRLSSWRSTSHVSSLFWVLMRTRRDSDTSELRPSGPVGMSFDNNGPDLLICSMHAGSEISGRAGLLRAAQLAHQRVRPSTNRGCTGSLRESLIGCYYHAVALRRRCSAIRTCCQEVSALWLKSKLPCQTQTSVT